MEIEELRRQIAFAEAPGRVGTVVWPVSTITVFRVTGICPGSLWIAFGRLATLVALQAPPLELQLVELQLLSAFFFDYSVTRGT